MYTHITPPDEVVRAAVVRACQDVCGVVLVKGDVRVIGMVAYISAEPILKNTLFLSTTAILLHIEQNLGARKVQQIR